MARLVSSVGSRSRMVLASLSDLFLVSWRLAVSLESGLSRSRGRLGDLIGDITGALLSEILLKMAIISWLETVCCAMVLFQIELF